MTGEEWKQFILDRFCFEEAPNHRDIFHVIEEQDAEREKMIEEINQVQRMREEVNRVQTERKYGSNKKQFRPDTTESS